MTSLYLGMAEVWDGSSRVDGVDFLTGVGGPENCCATSKPLSSLVQHFRQFKAIRKALEYHDEFEYLWLLGIDFY